MTRWPPVLTPTHPVRATTARADTITTGAAVMTSSAVSTSATLATISAIPTGAVTTISAVSAGADSTGAATSAGAGAFVTVGARCADIFSVSFAGSLVAGVSRVLTGAFFVAFFGSSALS